MTLPLVPRPTELAALTVQSEPTGANVQLDGKTAGAGGIFTHVPFGMHQLTATRDRYLPFSRELQVSEGMAPVYAIKLEPVPQPTELAALSVRTEPLGALVQLDGHAPDQPPGTFVHVPFGKHQLTATREGYLPWSQEVQVSDGTNPELKVSLQKGHEFSPEYLAAYVRLVQSLRTSRASNFEEQNKKLEAIIERLKSKTPPIARDEFRATYHETIKDAAGLDILPAMLLLAEHENDHEALKWFQRAAEFKNDSYAMMKVGRLYFKRQTPTDDETGFAWLNRAFKAPRPNLEAGAYIGDCYLSGKGTQPDEQKAKDIILPLADQNVVPAMTLAGKIRQHEAETLRTTNPLERDKLYSQARRWFERAAEKGDWNALARLGQYYEDGIGGVNKSEAEAEKRYREGIDHGNPLSMFFLWTLD